MYRCSICSAVRPRGQPRLTHIIHRANGDIDRELPVCSGCQFLLHSGKTLADLTQACQRGRAKLQVKEVLAAPPTLIESASAELGEAFINPAHLTRRTAQVGQEL